MYEIRKSSHKILTWIQDIGLLIISVFTVFAIGLEVNSIIEAKAVQLADLLLLFIYLEVLAMAAIYLNTGKMPVRIPLYIAIVALARYLIIDMKNLDTLRIVGVATAVLVIAIAVLLIRYGHSKYPYNETDEG